MNNINANQVRSVTMSQVTITRPDNTTAYTAGDAVSVETSNDMFVLPCPPGGSVLEWIRLKCSDEAIVEEFSLWIFSAIVAETADNAAFAPATGVLDELIDIINIPVAGWKATAVDTINQVRNIDLAFKSGKNLYCQLVIEDTLTPVAESTFTLVAAFSGATD